MSRDHMNHPRWWISGPEPDESLRSIVERAVALYGCRGDDYRPHLPRHATPYGASASGLDALPIQDILAVARMIGVPASELFMHRLPDHPALLQEHERRVFCPLCWQSDRGADRPLVFRRAWADIFALSCTEHGVPLHWINSLDAANESFLALRLTPSTNAGKEILELIHGFANTLKGSLYGSVTWPPGWRGSAFSARALLMRCASNLGCLPEHLPISNIWAEPDLREFIAVPGHRAEPLHESPWECMRAMGPPAWRRAAFWLVAWYVIPGMAMTLRPPGLPFAPFEEIDAQWDVQPERRDMRRLQRYRRVLIAMSRVFPVCRGPKGVRRWRGRQW